MNGEVAISVSYEGIYRGTGKRAVDIIGAGVGIFFAIPFFCDYSHFDKAHLKRTCLL